MAFFTRVLRSIFLMGFVLVALLLGFTATCHGDEISKLKVLFKSPPREYSTGPLWVWNDMVTEEEVQSTLRDLAGQRVKQVWIHPRPGLMTPYLGEDWFRLWRVALKEAEQLDMNVWIYDENSYPSGFAGGFVPEAMPESRGRGIRFQETTNAPMKWNDSWVAAFQAASNEFINVTSRLRSGEALGDGRYLMVSEVPAGDDPWHGNRCYVNLLTPGVTEKFLEITMEAYRREVGQEFGKRIPGVFTDEPNIRPAGGLPWSSALPDAFKKKWGYDLVDSLSSLTRQTGDWKRVRHNYFSVLNQQFIEHWARPYHDYCASNHLEWTGHYWDHDWPQCIGVPDNMAMYAWHQRPAIDCLMNQYNEGTHGQFGNARMGKELSSVANQLGIKRTLCEAYGAGGWDLRFEDMKRIGDWLEVLGINTLNQHLSYVTIRGARKRDHPQSFSYHEPWWEAYHVSAEYFARLSLAMSQGEQVNPLLVLEPTTTAWMYQGQDDKLGPLGDKFCKLLMRLESAQVEYDLGCEHIIARHGAVSANGLRVGQRDYKVVLIPELTENLDLKTAQLLDEFVQTGGTVLCCGDTPERIDGAETKLVAAASPNWKQVDTESALKQLPAPGMTITRAANDRGILFHHLRKLPEAELLLLVNTSIEAPSSGLIESQFAGVEQWDLYAGKVVPYPYTNTSSGLQAKFTLPPSGSLLLCLMPKATEILSSGIEQVAVISAADEPSARRIEPNVLTVDFVDITAGGQTRSNIYFYEANKFAWKQNGMERERNPWDSAVQFKDELISKTFPSESGFAATYRFRIAGVVPPNIEAVVERPDLYAITCNGEPVEAIRGAWWLDKSFGRIDLSKCARSGDNELTIRASPFTMYHEFEAAYILGDFSLGKVKNGFVIEPVRALAVARAESGSTNQSRSGWNEQGMPFYSAGVAYTETFELRKLSGSYFVSLPDWYGSVAKVSVNGRAVGYIDAPPNESDVTRFLRRGKNRIEVTVIGTLKNTLGPHHGNPVLGAAWPSNFQKAPASGPPDGRSYSTVAYGLFKPFVLKQVIVGGSGQTLRVAGR